MRARSLSAHGRAVSEPPERPRGVTRARCPRDRGREGALLFGYFLLGKQEKVTRSPWMASEKAQGREAVLAKRQNQSEEQGPRLRGDDDGDEVTEKRNPSPPNPPLEGEG